MQFQRPSHLSLIHISVAGEETDESFAFEYTITNRDGTTDPVTFELTHGEKAEISVPNGAKLEVTETNAEGYTTSYEITGGVTGSGTGTAATIDPVPLAGATIAFTNTRNTVDVTIEKQVTGNMGDRSKDFEFVLSGADADGNTLKFSGSQSGGFTVDPSGSEKIQFTLKHGQYVTPVSYTHLDVYKRQDQKHPRGRRGGHQEHRPSRPQL